MIAADVSPTSRNAVVVRNLLRIVDGIFSYLVGLIVMLSTQRKWPGSPLVRAGFSERASSASPAAPRRAYPRQR